MGRTDRGSGDGILAEYGRNIKSKLIIVYLLMFAMVVAGIVNTNLAQRKTEQKFCKIVNTAVSAMEEAPPTTAIGQQIQKDYLQLQNDLNC